MTIDPHSSAAIGLSERTASLRRVPASILAISLALCSTISATAQNWTPLDEVVGGKANGIVSDSVGNIYIAGGINDPTGLNGALILKSSDRGQTWDADPSTPDEDPSFYLPAAPGASLSFQALATAHVQVPGNLFQDQIVAIGYSPAGWFAYRSVNAGAVGGWSQIATPSNWNFLGYTQPALRSASIDSFGNIYVVGYATKTITTTVKNKTTTTSESRWLVFKGSRIVNQEGVESYAWSTTPIDDFPGSAWGVACAGSDVFVAGASGAYWHVRKSSDGGATWGDVDHYQLEAGYSAQANAITVDQARGRVVVAGYASGTQRISGKSVDTSYWIVRSGTGIGSGSFTRVDMIGGPVLNNRAYAVTLAPDGSVYTSGWLRGSSGSSGVVTWTTRKGNETNGTWSWSADDSFAFAPDQYAQCFGNAATPLGDIFAIGSANYHGGWLVRARLVP